MTKENIEILGRIFTALGSVSTKGEDTIIMADCLRALQQVLQDVAKTENDEPANAVATDVEE